MRRSAGARDVLLALCLLKHRQRCAARQCKAVHGGIYGKRNPLAGLGLYYTGRKRRTGPGGRTDYLGELGSGYEKLPQPQAEGTVVTVAYRTKARLASTLVVKADYYNGDGALAGTVVQNMRRRPVNGQ